MEEESFNIGVRNNNGKGGRSFYSSLSMVIVLAAVFIFHYNATGRGFCFTCCGYLAVRSSLLCGVIVPQYVALLTGQPNSVAVHKAVPVTVPTVRHHAVL